MQSPADSIEQLDAMRLGVEYKLTIKVRGFALVVRPLSISETLEVAHEVGSVLASLPQTAQTKITEQVLIAKHTLIKASTTDVGVNDPKITHMILDRMTADEVTLLFKQFVSACDKVNPALETLPDEELKSLVDGLKKNGASEAIELSFLQLANIVRYLLTKND